MRPRHGYNGLKFLIVALIIVLSCSRPASGQGSILDSLYTFRAGNVRINAALEIITRRTGYNFTYDSRLINNENKVDLNFTRVSLGAILDTILSSDSLKYTVIDRYIIISRVVPLREVTISSESTEELFYIAGIISDAESKERLPFATLSVKNTARGTVANSTGEFIMKLGIESLSDTISVSHLGYRRREIPVIQAVGNNLTITLVREFISIPEIIIRTHIPQEIIRKSTLATIRNYGNTPALLTGFYREGVMKKDKLQVYSEAIVRIFKSSYGNTMVNDQLKIIRSRKIENTSESDTLAVRLKAGLSTCLELDGMRNKFDFMQSDNLNDYTFRITDIVSTDEGAAYVIEFEQREGVAVPLFRGEMYIDADDYALLHAQFEINPLYIRDMKSSFVSSSSRGFDTWPRSVKYSVSYRKVNGRYFLNHVRGDLVFVSKRVRKLFNSEFNVFFELAVTGIRNENVERFDREELAPVHSVFSRTITSYDYQFWGGQDFLKPEDNLLQELKNMKVNLFEFSEEK